MQKQPEFSESVTQPDLKRVMGDFRPIGAVFDEWADEAEHGLFLFGLGMAAGGVITLIGAWALAVLLFSLGAAQ